MYVLRSGKDVSARFDLTQRTAMRLTRANKREHRSHNDLFMFFPVGFK